MVAWGDCDDDAAASPPRARRVVVEGIVRESRRRGSVELRETTRGWRQVGFDEAQHLCREYVSGETLDVILDKWVPVDFVSASATEQ